MRFLTKSKKKKKIQGQSTPDAGHT